MNLSSVVSCSFAWGVWLNLSPNKHDCSWQWRIQWSSSGAKKGWGTILRNQKGFPPYMSQKFNSMQEKLCLHSQFELCLSLHSQLQQDSTLLVSCFCTELRDSQNWDIDKAKCWSSCSIMRNILMLSHNIWQQITCRIYQFNSTPKVTCNGDPRCQIELYIGNS